MLLRYLIIFLIGFFLFPLWDSLLRSLDIIRIQHVLYQGVSWWNALFGGLVFVLGTYLCFQLDSFWQIKVKPRRGLLAYELLYLVLFYIALYFLRTYPYFLLLTLLMLTLVKLIIFYQPLDYLYFFGGAFLGPTLMLFLTNFSLYIFSEPDFLGIPFWLPLFWANLGLMLRHIFWKLLKFQPPKPGISKS